MIGLGRSFVFVGFMGVLGLFGLACTTTSPATGGGGTQDGARDRAKRMPVPTHLDDATRKQISAIMQAHGDDMTVLLWSILFLDMDGTAEYARAIGGQPKLRDQMAAGNGRGVPVEIFTLQEALAERAGRIEALAASQEKKPEALAEAFGSLAKTCVQCHAQYLYENRTRE